ncbi:2 TM domain-containing transmembrane protein [Acrasis kona]|uniref:Dolichyl-diphosphooligosaccharide-protein glycosyltransferase subunit OST5 n=1 Tax=Acrasis kona TaxID=1008807 RepID=A0AAW2ZEA2_9EUKA
MSLPYKPFHSPVDPASYPKVAVSLVTIGLALMAWFMVYETTTSTVNKNIKTELVLAILASVVLGLGLFFLLLWCGVYV